METIEPRSKLAFLSFGILLSELCFSEYREFFFLIGLGIFCFSIAYLLSFKKIFYILLGVSIGCGILSYRLLGENKNSASLSILEDRLRLNPELTVSIEPISLIRREVYLSRIRIGSYPDEWLAPIYLANKTNPDRFNCLASSIYLQKVGANHYLYKNTKRSGKRILKFSPKNCLVTKEIIFPSRLAKDKVLSLLNRGNIKEPFRGISMGLIFGESQYLDKDLYQSAQESGTLHLFAASGLHIGILIGSLYIFGKKILRFRYYSALFFPLGFAWIYLYLLSFPVSLTRAFFFALLLVLGKVLFRRIRPADLLYLSAAVVFIFREDSYRSIGFYLSFAAVAGIFFIKPRLDKVLFGKNINPIQENLTLSLSANFGTIPIVWIYFPGYSFGSLISNFFLVPWTGIVLPLLYFNLGIESILSETITDLIWPWTDLSLRILVLGTEFFAGAFGFYLKWGDYSRYFIIALALIVIYFFVSVYFPKKRTITATLGFLFVPAFFITGFWINKNQDGHPIPEGIHHLSNDSFFFLENKSGYLGGYCKFDSRRIKSILDKEFCQGLEELYIDHESCVSFARFCQKKNGNLTILFGSKRLKDWNPAFLINSTKIIQKKSNFTYREGTVFFYKAGMDPSWLPKFISKKNKPGTLILQMPSIGKKRWGNKSISQKSLGLPYNWKILNLDEAVPLFSANRDQEDIE